jgi:hypothetical protein
VIQRITAYLDVRIEILHRREQVGNVQMALRDCPVDRQALIIVPPLCELGVRLFE